MKRYSKGRKRQTAINLNYAAQSYENYKTKRSKREEQNDYETKTSKH